MPEPTEPKWDLIAESAVWKKHIAPMLDALYQEALEEKATTSVLLAHLSGAPAQTAESYHFWRGWCAAVKHIRSMPAEMAEANRQEKIRETEDEIIREQTRPRGRPEF